MTPWLFNNQREKPVTIVDYRKNEDTDSFYFHFDSAAIKKIVGRAEGHPILVYCMTGRQRHGKSYLNDWCRRYLEDLVNSQDKKLEAHQEDGWKILKYSTDGKPSVAGFQSAGGKRQVTRGIWAWSEPFIIKTDNADKKKIAVILLDAEGFDSPDRDFHVDITLISISILLSNVLMYSLQTTLSRTDLDFLNSYLQVALYYNQEIDGPSASSVHKTKELLLIVRDFNRSEGEEYGPCSLDDFLANQGSLLGMMREVSRTGTDAFLFPPPCFSDARDEIGRKEYNALGAEFRKQLDNFLEIYFGRHFFNSSLDGNQRMMTGKCLLENFEHLKTIMKGKTSLLYAFAGSGTAEVPSWQEMVEGIFMLKYTENKIKQLRSELDQLFDSGSGDRIDLLTNSKSIKEKFFSDMKENHPLKKYMAEEKKKMIDKGIEENIEKEINKYSEISITKLKTAKEKALKVFKAHMESKCSGWFSQSRRNMTRWYKRYKIRASNTFRRETLFPVIADNWKDHGRELIEEILAENQKFEEENVQKSVIKFVAAGYRRFVGERNNWDGENPFENEDPFSGQDGMEEEDNNRDNYQTATEVAGGVVAAGVVGGGAFFAVDGLVLGLAICAPAAAFPPAIPIVVGVAGIAAAGVASSIMIYNHRHRISRLFASNTN